MKLKWNLPIIIGVSLLVLGGTSFYLAILLDSLSLTFIGLGLTFWGILLFYIRPTRHIRADIINSLIFSPLLFLDKMLEDLNTGGKGIYLPPKTLRELVDVVLFIPLEEEINVPPVHDMLENIIYVSNPHGIYLRPIGLDLAKKFEEELGIDWNKVDLDYLQKNLPKVLVEYLEIVEDVEIETKENMIYVKIFHPILKDIYSKLTNLCQNVGDPLSSSIACALVKVCGSPIIIDNINISPDNEIIEIQYRILKEEETYSTLSHIIKLNI